MVTALVLLNVRRSEINDTAARLAEMPGISEVYSVSGPYDLVAIIRAGNNDDLAELVTNRMPHIDAITRSETMLAFKAHSRHDLEQMFSIGLE